MEHQETKQPIQKNDRQLMYRSWNGFGYNQKGPLRVNMISKLAYSVEQARIVQHENRLQKTENK